jgi:hypothetical protein
MAGAAAEAEPLAQVRDAEASALGEDYEPIDLFQTSYIRGLPKDRTQLFAIRIHAAALPG